MTLSSRVAFYAHYALASFALVIGFYICVLWASMGIVGLVNAVQ
jgi:hypothetical protein